MTDQWNVPCQAVCCVVDGRGDPTPEEGGAIPEDPVENETGDKILEGYGE